jgi:hypothetical protein
MLLYLIHSRRCRFSSSLLDGQDGTGSLSVLMSVVAYAVIHSCLCARFVVVNSIRSASCLCHMLPLSFDVG